MTDKSTPRPWEIIEDQQWPFHIRVVNDAGDIVMEERRWAFSSADTTLDDVMSCRNHGKEDRDSASAGNCRQLATIRRIVASVNALSNWPIEAIEQIAKQGGLRLPDNTGLVTVDVVWPELTRMSDYASKPRGDK